MSYSFAAGQGGATLRISLVVGAGLTQQEVVCSHVGTDRECMATVETLIPTDLHGEGWTAAGN